jgi:hypothetical protein
MDIGPSEAETFWTKFLRKLRRRALRGVKLVVSDAHEGLKAAAKLIASRSDGFEVDRRSRLRSSAELVMEIPLRMRQDSHVKQLTGSRGDSRIFQTSAWPKAAKAAATR